MRSHHARAPECIDMKLYEFLAANKVELVERCRGKVSQRSPGAPTRGLLYGIAPFLDQLIKTLEVEQTSDPMQSRKVSGPAGGQIAQSEIGGTATEHGRELMRHGYSLEEVVHDYGDLCQAITDLAFERGAEISTDEFRTVNRCLDNAIAVAVTEFAYQRDTQAADQQSLDATQRLGIFAHELRNFLTTATLAVNIIKSGNVGLAGATGQILDRSLLGMRNLIDRSLAEVRIESGSGIEPQVFSLAGLIAELKVTASLEAAVRQSVFIVADVEPKLALSGDRDLLLAAVGNLLQNAFKFTRPGTEVTLNAYSAGGRIHIDVEDNCGGLRAGDAESMFLPYVQRGTDKSGVGLGLSIARRSVEANGGTLSVRDVPGTGCVFTIDLPRHLDPTPRVDADASRSIA
jgi:signal transduction histidine kinase